MKAKIKKLLKNGRVITLLVFLLFAAVAIHPRPGREGVVIRNVVTDSAADLADIQSPDPGIPPMSKERIVALAGAPVASVVDYYKALERLSINTSVTLKTNKGVYRITPKEAFLITQLNETVNQTVNETVLVNETINGTVVQVNTTVEKVIQVPKINRTSLGVEDIGISVSEAPTTNIRKGLDLEGGTRVLLQPDQKLDTETMEVLISNMKQRLNVFGLSDIVVRKAGDLSGNQFVVVEIAGAKEEEVKGLLAKQGKFEAKIGEDVVFKGGKDVTYVCRTADCAGIDPQQGCGRLQEASWTCRFSFAISLSPAAAKRQANVTQRLGVLTLADDGSALARGDQYLDKNLDLYLDDALVDTLRIAADLRGRATTDISISGSGVGGTEQEAVGDALENMKGLQTILITGSLPVKMNLVKTDSISPVLGKAFVANAILIGLLSIIAVSVVIFIRYRNFFVVLGIITTIFSEVFLLLGLAALIGWNLDLAAIAGIIVAVGTGVDHQIVITDEARSKDSERVLSWKQKLKRAFYIIMAAYFTALVALIPLWWAGTGLLRGFAITTIMGISFGVFVTRPAFAVFMETLEH